jgi:rhodanese-related sulfurtransferase
MMGPFVPDLISDQLNLVVALFLGMGFGLVLEQAGFSSSRKLAGVFYGYDFTVLRVFFTAAVTAMGGVLLLGYFGLLDLDVIYINPTWLAPAIVGGAIMGAGFILGGYCPGTSLAAAAIGKLDGMVFVAGGALGVFGFGELYSHYKHFYESTPLGPIRVFDSIGISQGLFAFLLIAAAVAAFAVTTLIEKRVAGESAPSRAFSSRRDMAAGAALIILGAVLLFLPDRKTHMIARVSDPVFMAAHPVAAMDIDELAFRLVDRDPRVQVVDIRSGAAFARQALPGARNIAMRDFFGQDAAPVLSPRHVKKVVVGDSEDQEHAASLLLAELGYENAVVLKGGFGAFQTAYLGAAGAAPAEVGRWAADITRFRAQARGDILQMIAASKAAPKAAKPQKKIAGGC